MERVPDEMGGADLVMPNAGAALKQHVLHTSGMGTSNTQSIYYQLWQAVAQAAAPGSLSQVLKDSSISSQQRKLALQYRNGNLFNQKHAFRCKKAENPNCLCCGNPDSATHMLQGPCTEAHSGLVSNRHHGAVGLIAKSVLKGHRGGDLKFVDISTKVADRLGVDTGGQDKRWRDLRETLTGQSGTHSSRPDIVLIQEDARSRQPTNVILVEVKYCADTSWLQKYEQAMEQHAELETRVRQCLSTAAPKAGCKRTRNGHMGMQAQAQVETVVLLIGVAGTTYRKYTLDPLVQKLGLEPDRARRLLSKLTRHSLEHAVMLRNHRSNPMYKQHG